jgi:hypothetical protein
LIKAIIQCTKDRASNGSATCFIKVKAHVGIVGNEMADGLAKEAVGMTGEEPTAHNITIGADPYGSMFWLAATDNTASLEHPDLNDEGRLSPVAAVQYVNNLNHDLSTRAYKAQGVAGTNESVYAALMKQELLMADTKVSTSMWDLATSGKLTYTHISNAMRVRWGGLYTAKTAARMNRPYMRNNGPPSSGQCPLCGMADSATHILGECPAHTPLHIQRHDATGRCLLKHMRKGAHGGYYMIADVGSMDKLAPYGITEKRIPQWMMPTATLASRLDIAMVHTRAVDVNAAKLPRAGTMITAIEIGYRSDYDPELRKMAEKQEQHVPTCDGLRQRYTVDYQIWDIGHTGMIPKRLREQATRLGVANVDKLLKDIHRIAVEHALLLVHDRRAKEKETLASENQIHRVHPRQTPRTHARGVG